MRVAGLILAAGRSSRMGRDKALLDYRGKTFLNHLVYLLLPRVDEVVVVLGHNAAAIGGTLPPAPRVRAVVNAGYDRGMLSSLQKGLDAVPADTDWVLWMLVDHPAVRGRTLDALLAAAGDGGAPLVIPRHEGQRGHPVALSRSVSAELSALEADRSPQDVVRSHYARARFVDLPDPAVLVDIDRPDDYRRLRRPAGSDG